MSETVTPQTSKIDALTQEAREALEQLPGPVTKFSRRDLIAGFTNAVANIPDSMANAVLAGVNPVHGLYALVFGTPVAALTTSSKLMTVAVTGSMALVVADALAPIPPEARSTALLGLVLLVGIIQVALGLLRAGSLVRFVSNSVMRGFLTGVAINIVLSQVPDVTGYQSEASNKVMRVVDVLLHPCGISVPTVLVALLTIGIILAAERTRIRSFAFPAALVVSTIVAYVTPISVELVGDSAQLPTSLPTMVLPQAGTFAGLLIPALSVAIVGLIQGAGISKSVPNPDGTYADLNRDFMGQGAGNLASAFFGGMPVGGSLSSTAVNVQLGGRHRIANVMIAPVIATVLLVLSPAVELIPTATLGAMLVLIGSRAIDVPAIRAVWQTSVQTRTIMLITFIGTLVVPVQYAVIIGVALSIVQYTYRSSLDVRVVSLTRDDQARYVEGEAPESLPDDSITVLRCLRECLLRGHRCDRPVAPQRTRCLQHGRGAAAARTRRRGQHVPGTHQALQRATRGAGRLSGARGNRPGAAGPACAHRCRRDDRPRPHLHGRAGAHGLGGRRRDGCRSVAIGSASGGRVGSASLLPLGTATTTF